MTQRGTARKRLRSPFLLPTAIRNSTEIPDQTQATPPIPAVIAGGVSLESSSCSHWGICGVRFCSVSENATESERVDAIILASDANFWSFPHNLICSYVTKRFALIIFMKGPEFAL